MSERYARALLLYTQERGSFTRVCEQVRALLKNPQQAIELDPDLARFCSLVVSKGRKEQLKSILQSYLSMCYKEKGVKQVVLRTAVEEPGLAEKINELIGGELVMESSVDSSLIAGFVLEMEGQRLDASVKSQIEALRKQFIQDNNRIV